MSHVPVVQQLRSVAFATAGSEVVPPWLTDDDRTPLVYFTFGTVFNTDIPLLRSIIDGLALLAVRVLVTVGPRGDPDSFGTMPDNVHVARYVPQTEVLPHVSLVVSHAGSGTFLAALGQGIPLLCIPQAADQFGNAAAAQRVGAGLTIPPGQVTSDAVCEAAARLLQEAGFRSAARAIEQEIRQMPGPDIVADIIGSLVQDRS